MVRRIYKTFLKGLITLLPVALTIYVLVWLCAGLERFFGSIVQWILPGEWYITGLGLLLGLAFVFAVGLLFEAWGVRKLWRWLEWLLHHLPVIRSVYGPVKDIIKYLGGQSAEEAKDVVAVSLADSFQVLGMVTRKDFSKLPEGLGGDDMVAVYCPMSYQVGGYTIFVSASKVR